MFFAIWKLYQFLSVSSWRHPRVATICIGLEIFANIERLLYIAIDPLGSTHTLQRYASMIMQELAISVAIVIEVLVLLVWLDATVIKSVSKAGGVLQTQRSQIVFGAVVAGAIALDMISACLQGAYLTSVALIYVVGILFLVIQIVVVGLFVYAGLKVLNGLLGNVADSLNKVSKKLVRLLFIMGGFSLIVVVAGILQVTVIEEHPLGDFGVWFTIFFCVDSFSLAQLISFSPATTSTSANSNTASTTSATSSK